MDSPIRDEICKRLSEGESLSSICRGNDMPSREAVRLWQRDDPAFDLAVTHAREDGYEHRATLAVLEAKAAEDASLGRLAFDAERWYLGKLSNAFADKVRHVGGGPDDEPIKHEHDLTEEAADAFTRAITSLATRD